jgi:hypothetical protein
MSMRSKFWGEVTPEPGEDEPCRDCLIAWKEASIIALRSTGPWQLGLSRMATVPPEIVRAALKACLACSRTHECAAWLALGHPDVPLFCRARAHFLEIAVAPPRIGETPDCPTGRI